MDGLYLCGENDTKMWFFNFRSSKICLRLNPPKVTVLTVVFNKVLDMLFSVFHHFYQFEMSYRVLIIEVEGRQAQF